MTGIGTLLRIGLLGVVRDRVVLALTFLLPVLFFSIFASVFGNQRDTTARINVVVADLDQPEFSKKLVKALIAEPGLRARVTEDPGGTGDVLDSRERAEKLVRDERVP